MNIHTTSEIATLFPSIVILNAQASNSKSESTNILAITPTTSFLDVISLFPRAILLPIHVITSNTISTASSVIISGLTPTYSMYATTVVKPANLASDTVSDVMCLCLYVYEIDEQCIPQSIIVSYFTDTDNYFGIEQYHHFNPDNTYSDDKWVEIDKEEFETHFNIVQDKITKSINSDLKK